MSKNWYPIINYQTCIKCGACIKKCLHEVFDKKEAPNPKVIFKEGCIESCHGCGNLCPSGSITYFGENTDWTAPSLSKNTSNDEQDCTCGGNC